MYLGYYYDSSRSYGGGSGYYRYDRDRQSRTTSATGISNQGNTCYINASLQSILPAIASALKIEPNPTSQVGIIFKQLVASRITAEDAVLSLQKILNRAQGEQDDVSLFVRDLIQYMIKENDPLADLLTVKYALSNCEACEFKPITRPESGFVVPPGASTVLEGIKKRVHGAVRCKKCKKPLGHAIVPRYLFVSVDAGEMVNCELRLHLKGGRELELIGVAYHSGNYTYGHATAHTKRNGAWEFCNDSTVQPDTECAPPGVQFFKRKASSSVIAASTEQATDTNSALGGWKPFQPDPSVYEAVTQHISQPMYNETSRQERARSPATPESVQNQVSIIEVKTESIEKQESATLQAPAEASTLVAPDQNTPASRYASFAELLLSELQRCLYAKAIFFASVDTEGKRACSNALDGLCGLTTALFSYLPESIRSKTAFEFLCALYSENAPPFSLLDSAVETVASQMEAEGAQEFKDNMKFFKNHQRAVVAKALCIMIGLATEKPDPSESTDFVIIGVPELQGYKFNYAILQRPLQLSAVGTVPAVLVPGIASRQLSGEEK